MKTFKIFFFIILSTFTLGQNKWEHLNSPYGGDVKLISFDLAGKIFAGVYNGGLYYSSNNGEKWNAIKDGIDYETLTSLAFSETGKMYCGTYYGLFFSTDSGESWLRDDNFAKYYVQNILINDENKIFVTTEKGLYRSTNNGGSWNLLDSTLMGDMVVNSEGYIFTTKDAETFKSTDQGDSWNKVNGNLPQNRIKYFKINSNDEIIAVLDNNNIYRTTNDGLTWENINNGKVFGLISAVYFDNNKILVGTYTDLFLTTNNGLTWNSLKNESLFNYWIESINCKNDNTIFVGTYGGGIYYTNDQGQNWTLWNEGLENPLIRDMVITDSLGTIFTTAYGAGIFKSTNMGATWEEKMNSLNTPYIGTIYSYKNEKLFTGTYTGVFSSTDEGETWLLSNNGFTATAVNGFISNSNGDIFASVQGQGILKSTNGGLWTLKMNGVSELSVQNLIINNNDIMYITTGPDKVYRSKDNGENWEVVFNDNSMIIRTVAGSDHNDIYVGTKGIYRSTDNGDSWEKLNTPPEMGYVVSIKAINENLIYAATVNDIFYSINGGNNWYLLNEGIESCQKSKLKYFGGDYIYLITYANGIFRYNINHVLPVELISFKCKINNSSVILEWLTATELNNKGFEIERRSFSSEWEKIGYVEGVGNSTITKSYSFQDNTIQKKGEYIYRLKQIDYSGEYKYSNEVRIDLNIKPEKFILYQNFPNPFNPKTMINYVIENDEFVTLSIYSMLGEKVKDLVSEMQTAGKHTIEFDASDLASGIYIYQLKAGKFTQTKKMMLMR